MTDQQPSPQPPLTDAERNAIRSAIHDQVSGAPDRLIETLRNALARGYSIDAPYFYQYRLTGHAITYPNKPLFDFLLDNGADINLTHRTTPLAIHILEQAKSLSIKPPKLDGDAQPGKADYFNYCFHRVLEKKPDLTQRDEDGKPFPHRLIDFHQYEVLDWLLKHKLAIVDSTDAKGNTELMYALTKGDKAAASVLLDHHANIHKRNNANSSPNDLLSGVFNPIEVKRIRAGRRDTATENGFKGRLATQAGELVDPALEVAGRPDAANVVRIERAGDTKSRPRLTVVGGTAASNGKTAAPPETGKEPE